MPMALEPPPTQATTRSGSRFSALQHLGAGLVADHGLEIAHHRGIGMRPRRRTDDVERVVDIGDPVAQRLVHRVLQGARAGRDAAHFRAQQAHAEDIGLLPLHVHFAHIDDARQAEARRHCGGGHAMLAGAGLGDDAGLAHAAGQQDLAQAIVDLVRAGVIEVFALEIDFRAAQMRGQPLGEIERAFAADIMGQQARSVRPERRDPSWPPHRPFPAPGSAASGFRRQSGRHRRRNGRGIRAGAIGIGRRVHALSPCCLCGGDEIARSGCSLLTPGALSTPEETSTICAPLTAIARATLSGLRPPARNQGWLKRWPVQHLPVEGDAMAAGPGGVRGGRGIEQQHVRDIVIGGGAARSAGSATGSALIRGMWKRGADIGGARRAFLAMQLEKIRLHLGRRSAPAAHRRRSTTSATSFSRPRMRSANCAPASMLRARGLLAKNTSPPKSAPARTAASAAAAELIPQILTG